MFHIMVVEDDTELRDLFCAVLTERGYQTLPAADGLEDKRRGFRAGTDDYMVKPIDVNEMVWRVEALLRRSQIYSERRITIGSTVLDCDSLTVSFGGTDTSLPQK